jgi:hypothetical protein
MGIQLGDILAFKYNPAGRRGIGAGNDIKESGFAGTVGSGDAKDFPLLDGHIDIDEGFDSSKSLGYFFGLENHQQTNLALIF